MANTQNLKILTSEEARKYGRKGGIASGKARAMRKTFREAINDNLDDKTLEAMIKAMIKETKKGNTRAFELLRDTVGEKPIEQIQNINPPVIKIERPKE
ncbi:MAG TPA: hypothetical protein IAB27_05265 [Candidatus Coprosoma intestinipullorum]|uniref:Uncharacterized protein n=1 Tax=Candidatus Coprosoma intestinipullorum TaxID=2840752 RepID=A0A9D0ZR70_9FIRM|nr:hypothetical protein [Candidatus Coprosoma intestinipullorum]